MSSTANLSTINAYARSMLELANEQNQLDAVAGEMTSLGDVMRSDPAFASFLADPSVGVDERKRVLEKTFAGKLSPLMMNFVRVLDGHRRAGLLPEIADRFAKMLADQRGIVEVDVTVAKRLDDSELEQVRSRVSQALGKTAVVQQFVDDSIIGGLKLRVGDKLIDASAKYQLQQMRQRMMSARKR